MNAYKRAILKSITSGKTVRRKSDYQDFPFTKNSWYWYPIP